MYESSVAPPTLRITLIHYHHFLLARLDEYKQIKKSFRTVNWFNLVFLKEVFHCFLEGARTVNSFGIPVRTSNSSGSPPTAVTTAASSALHQRRPSVPSYCPRLFNNHLQHHSVLSSQKNASYSPTPNPPSRQQFYHWPCCRSPTAAYSLPGQRHPSSTNRFDCFQ